MAVVPPQPKHPTPSASCRRRLDVLCLSEGSAFQKAVPFWAATLLTFPGQQSLPEGLSVRCRNRRAIGVSTLSVWWGSGVHMIGGGPPLQDFSQLWGCGQCCTSVGERWLGSGGGAWLHRCGLHSQTPTQAPGRDMRSRLQQPEASSKEPQQELNAATRAVTSFVTAASQQRRSSADLIPDRIESSCVKLGTVVEGVHRSATPRLHLHCSTNDTHPGQQSEDQQRCCDDTGVTGMVDHAAAQLSHNEPTDGR